MKRVISQIDVGSRLDLYVFGQLTTVNRSTVRKLIDQGKVTVNMQQVKSGYKLRLADEVIIDFDETELLDTPDVNLRIIYEDADCVVIDKPAGILSHSKGSFNPEATVATFISSKLQDMEGERAGIVHRLDRATSGVMICAKNQAAQSHLQKQFSQRKVKKMYLAIIEPGLEPPAAVIDMPIERDPRNPKKFRVGNNGKPAQTTYSVLWEKDSEALIELRPLTGRTHQLRVHLAQLKRPIFGDTLYGGRSASRMMLHAASLELTLPSRSRKVFESQPPSEFRVAL